MSKFSQIFYFIILLFVFVSVGNMVLMAEGKKCTTTWPGSCRDASDCDSQCENQYGGDAYCKFIVGTRQKHCVCIYNC
ncbi:hypothetical protein MKX01_025501 [Papaver californicum]|nr:hypothetical protein MKX01_025501 [Papaver californicum]